MTDQEFLLAIRKLNIQILTEKASELVKRPATRAAQKAYEKELERQRNYRKHHQGQQA